MSDVSRLKARIKEDFCKVIDESEEGFMSKEDKNVLTYNKDIQKMIDEELAKEPQECKWIPRSERLPEDLNDKNIDCFLVTDGFLIWMAYYNSGIGWQFAECTNSRNKIDWTEIVAWQPLPSVWKGENNAEK